MLTAMVVVSTLTGRLSVLLLGALVGRLQGLGRSEAIGPAAMLVAAMLAAWLVRALLEQVRPVFERDLMDRVKVVVGDRLITSAFASAEVSAVEDAGFADRVALARGELTGVPAHGPVPFGGSRL